MEEGCLKWVGVDVDAGNVIIPVTLPNLNQVNLQVCLLVYILFVI